jgi:glutathione S-transferase
MAHSALDRYIASGRCTMPVIVYGPALSTYVRSARVALEEKGVAYELKQLNFMGGEHKQSAHLARHPFGYVPAFEHDGFPLYETSAIIRYVDRAFPGPKLQPDDVRQLARMDQIIGIIDSYAYPSIVSKLVIERLVAPMMGRGADEATIAEAMPRVKLSLAELDRLAAGDGFLVGGALSLADIHLAPIFFYMTQTPEAASLLEPHGKLRAWWSAMERRPSMTKTPPQF